MGVQKWGMAASATALAAAGLAQAQTTAQWGTVQPQPSAQTQLQSPVIKWMAAPQLQTGSAARIGTGTDAAKPCEMTISGAVSGSYSCTVAIRSPAGGSTASQQWAVNITGNLPSSTAQALIEVDGNGTLQSGSFASSAASKTATTFAARVASGGTSSGWALSGQTGESGGGALGGSGSVPAWTCSAGTSATAAGQVSITLAVSPSQSSSGAVSGNATATCPANTATGAQGTVNIQASF